jgi:integrase
MNTVRTDLPTPRVSHKLELVSVRKRLPARREPWWGAQISAHRHVGYRKISADKATWIARLRDEAGVHKYKSLGPFIEGKFEYDHAKAAAEQWFKDHDAGITTTDVVTVADACRAYVKGLREDQRETTAHDADRRFVRTVYSHELGGRALTKLRTPHLKAWRNGLDLGKASANRTLTALKAALNLAVKNRQISPAAAIEWRQVESYEDAGQRRTLYLDLKQRRALLDAAKNLGNGVRDLIEAATLTGGRAGELVNATVSQFDARTKSMTFTGKTGSRTVPLAPAAVALFKRLATDKKPGDRLLVRDDGNPWAHSDWDELVRAAATAASLPDGTCLYTLRHSFVTTALTSGLATLDVARLVGTSVMMIEKHYGHLVASAARERLAKVAML